MASQTSRVKCVARAIARFSMGIGIAIGLLSPASPAAAADCIWSGAGGDARWSNPANWTNCPGAANLDRLHFPAGATPVSVNDIAGLTLLGIWIEGLPNVSNYVIMGAGVRIYSDSLVTSDQIALSADGRAPVIALPIEIFNPPVPGYSNRLLISSVTSLEMTGAITGNATSQLEKVNGGALILGSPANAWGQLSVSEGIVRINAAGALPAGSRVLLFGTTPVILDLEDFGATLSDLSSNSPFPAPFVAPRILLETGTLTVASGTFDGQIEGTSGSLVKVGPGDLRLSGPSANTYGGTTTVNGGALRMFKESGAAATTDAVIVNSGKLELVFPEQIADRASVTINAGGTLELPILENETIGSLEGGGAILLNSAALIVGKNNRSTTFTGTISGGFNQQTEYSLVKIGTGTLTLTGALTYQGNTDLLSGTLLVNGTIALGHIRPSTASSVYVDGGTLGGVGTIEPHLIMFNAGGTTRISPGTSPGILHIASGGLAGTFVAEINGPIAGSGYDQLDVTPGSIFLGGVPSLQVSLGYSPPAGARFTIVKSPAGPGHAPVGTFAGLPEGAELRLREQRFGISYRGGDGNDIVLTALEAPPAVSIDDVTVTEGNAGTTEAVFTVALSRAIAEAVGVQYTIANGTAAAPGDYTAQGGTLVFLPGTTTQSVTVSVTGDRDVEPDETFVVRLSGLSGVPASQGIVTIAKAQGAGIIASDDAARTYFLAEGATGSFFDTDVLIANPNATLAPVTLTFLKQDGEQVVARRSIEAWSHLTVHADLIPGLESTAASVTVTSESGVPLMVERTMFWDASYRAGHTGSSVDRPASDWLFAEGSQGFFSTFVLVANPHDTPADVTFTFLLDTGDPVIVTRTVAPTARLTLGAGEIPELADRSFGIAVHATQPITAERSMYFGSAAPGPQSSGWSGGTESAGVTSASAHWFLAEGATGDFFDTFILLSNPQSEPASVTVQYLLDFGEVITVPKVVPANGRLTIDIEQESDPRLHDAAVSTVVTSDRAIIAERSMYWAGLPWREAHNSFGVAELGTRWALAEGRVGGTRNFHTFVLLANPRTEAAHVTVTYLREEGAPLVRQYIVPPTSRFNIDVNAIVPEMHDESFGTLIEVTNGVAIAAERSMYWDAQGVFWSGGTNATGMRLP